MKHFGFQIAKAEKLEDGRMLVEGVFSSDSLDKQRDVVDLAATKRAVERWEAKNLREQHDSKRAVGKAIEFEYDEAKGTASFRGFVSAACPDVQTKVDEKVLSYFSIGAMVNKTEAFKAVDGKTARRIVDYDLIEISLVDNPANPDAKLKVAMAVAAGMDEAPAADPPAPEETRFGKALKAAVKPAEPAPEPSPTPKADEAPPAAVVPPAAAEPAPAPARKSGEEWDIRAALDILVGLKGLLYCETMDPETEPPAQRVALETAITAVQSFIASEATELEAAPAGEAAAMTAQPGLLKLLARAFAVRDAASEAELAAMKKTLSEAPVPFTAPEGEQLGEAMGQLLTFTKTLKPTPDTEKTEQISKAIGDFKTLFEGEVKAIRGDLEVIKAMPVPGGPIVRRLPGMQTKSSQPGVPVDSEIQVLEKRLSNTSDPAARAIYERDLRFARARKGLQP